MRTASKSATCTTSAPSTNYRDCVNTGPQPSSAQPKTKRRRTWPQRLLLLAGVLTAAGLFFTAAVFAEASTVLADLPRIAVGPDVLAQSGGPGEPVNLLLVGVDSSEGLDPDDPVRIGRELEDEARGIVRPDTILVARLDPATGSASVLSLPRDLIVEAPGGAATRINATQAVGGIEALIETIDSNYSIPINHFVVADFAGFAEVVDIVGGVPVFFPYPTRDLGSGLQIRESGCWALDGTQALSYVRARNLEEQVDGVWTPLQATSPDLARIERQQQFMVLALEQMLSIGRSDISRISEFIEAGAEAVQLDAELTPGDMLNLAGAFSDFDTESLEISTVPVSASFSEEGQYLGEQLLIDDAQQLLSRFQGRLDGVRPQSIDVNVVSTADRQSEQLAERGFVANRTETDEQAARTEVIFDPGDRDEALLLTRYLEGVPPVLTAGTGETLRLVIGNDFAGVRQFPRPEADIAPGLDLVIREAGALVEVPEEATTTTTTLVLATPTTDETSDTAFASSSTPDLPSTLAPQTTDVPLDPVIDELSTPTIVLRGRPPAGVTCSPIPGG